MFSTKSMWVPIALLVLVAIKVLHPRTTLCSANEEAGWNDKMAGRDLTKPTLLIFTADWCGACQQMRSDVLSRRDIRDELYDHYNVYSIDLTSPYPAKSVAEGMFARYSARSFRRFTADSARKNEMIRALELLNPDEAGRSLVNAMSAPTGLPGKF